MSYTQSFGYTTPTSKDTIEIPQYQALLKANASYMGDDDIIAKLNNKNRQSTSKEGTSAYLNAASPKDQPETIKFGVSKVDNVYKQSNIQNQTFYASSARGTKIRVDGKRIWRTQSTDVNTGLPVIVDCPLWTSFTLGFADFTLVDDAARKSTIEWMISQLELLKDDGVWSKLCSGVTRIYG